MKTNLSLFIAALFPVWCLHCNAAGAADAKPPVQMPKQFKFTRTQSVEINYLLFLPKGYSAESEKRWPLMLFLHGAGERGSDISKVAVHGPPKTVTRNPDFPFILVSPQCPEGERWSNEPLMALLDDVIGRHAVDTNRIYLTGLSMGGYGTWNLGMAYPERFAAIAPICGGGERIAVLLASREKAPALKALGVWAFHGAKDPVVPLEESQRMVDALKRIGVADVKFTVYPEAGHDSWTRTYKNPELYEWFLKHERTPAGAGGK
jgi:predicted peptidase